MMDDVLTAASLETVDLLKCDIEGADASCSTIVARGLTGSGLSLSSVTVFMG